MIVGHTVARFLGRATYLALADLASKSATVLLALIVARYLGPTTYGEYATAAAVVGLVMMITGIGFEQEFTRRAGRDAAALSPVFRLTMTGVTLSCIGTGLALAGVLMLSPYSDRVLHLSIVLGLAAVLTRHALPFRFLCLVLGKPGVAAIIHGLGTLGLVALTAIIIGAGGSVMEIAYAQLIVAVLLLVIWLRWLPGRAESDHDTRPAPSLLRLVRASLPFTISNMLWVAYFNFDTFMLSLLRSEDEVGVYAAVYRIIAINYVIGYALANTYTPTLFERFVRDRRDYVLMARGLSGTMLAAGALTAAALFLVAPVLVLAVFGPMYAAGVPVAQVLSIAVLFRLVNFGLAELLTTSDQQHLRVLLESGMLAINVGLNWMLIPAYGALGAAAATVAAEVFLFLGAAVLCRSLLFPRAMATQPR